MILRNLLRRPTRTILTIVGIAVGIAAIVTLVSLAKGLVTNYVEATNRTDADIILQAVQKREGQAISFGIGFDESLADRVRAMPEVKDASSVIYTLARVEGMPFFIVFGYEPDQPGIRHFHVTEGISLAEY
ncbi:MAG: ABC transporter permease, partial [Chloroflexi bacterium]|nr:ABC transporter permease [Chloroflexota bacterium]